MLYDNAVVNRLLTAFLASSRVFQLVVKQVDNLRSVLAKNGLLTIEDLCTGVGRNLDADIGAVVAILLKVRQ